MNTVRYLQRNLNACDFHPKTDPCDGQVACLLFLRINRRCGHAPPRADKPLFTGMLRIIE